MNELNSTWITCQRGTNHWLWLVVGLLVQLTGCHQGTIYKAAELPAQYAAFPVRSANSLNLSRLARATGDSEVIQSGDVLLISIATGLEERGPVIWSRRVSDDGTVSVPLVGPVEVLGLTLNEAELMVREQSVRSEIFIQPNVSVMFRTRQINRITVVGAVNKPGVKELPIATSSLVDALVAAGGLAENASTVVEIRYPQPVNPLGQAGWSEPKNNLRLASSSEESSASGSSPTVTFDLSDIEKNDGGGSFSLTDGVVLTVVQKPEPSVNVIGLVQKAGRFKIPEDTDFRVLDALALAGGRKMQLADHVKIVRIVPGEPEPVVVKVSIRRAKAGGAANLQLAAGDVVSVEETPLTFTLDMLRSFIRLGFSTTIPGL